MKRWSNLGFCIFLTCPVSLNALIFSLTHLLFIQNWKRLQKTPVLRGGRPVASPAAAPSPILRRVLLGATETSSPSKGQVRQVLQLQDNPKSCCWEGVKHRAFFPTQHRRRGSSGRFRPGPLLISTSNSGPAPGSSHAVVSGTWLLSLK